MAFSQAVRKATELARRSRALAQGPVGMVVPQGRSRAEHDAVLVLQRGANPTSAYYLEPRLQREATPAAVVDLHSDPADCGLVGPDGARSLMVIFCRYASPRWLRAVEALGPRVARAVFFADDDLPAMMRSADLPRSARGKIAAHYGAHVRRLEALCGEVWVSTPALAQRYPEARAVVLPPVPDAEAPAPAPAAERRVVYHGSDTHAAERAFVVEIARVLAARGCDAPVEIAGGDDLRAAAKDLPNLQVVPQAPWAAYRQAQRSRRAAVSLAPLSPSPINAARAPVKAFDAARLGAAGVFADCEPFRSFVEDGRDGVLLAPDPQAWAEAVMGLLEDAPRRTALAEAARERLNLLRLQVGGFPAAPAA